MRSQNSTSVVKRRIQWRRIRAETRPWLTSAIYDGMQRNWGESRARGAPPAVIGLQRRCARCAMARSFESDATSTLQPRDATSSPDVFSRHQDDRWGQRRGSPRAVVRINYDAARIMPEDVHGRILFFNHIQEKGKCRVMLFFHARVGSL